MVICLEQGADLRTAQLMPLPLTFSCFSKIQMVFAFLVRYDTRCYFNLRCYFNVRSKANISQLNLPHGTDNEKVENRYAQK